MLRVVIADDHKIFRESLRCMLGSDPEIDVVGTVGDEDELIACIKETRPDVVCMDIVMPGVNGIEATRHLIERQPDLKVIGLSAFPDRTYVLEMLNAGASGYVTKSEALEELQNAIHSVCQQDQMYFCPEVAKSLFDPEQIKAPGEEIQPLRVDRDSQEIRKLLADVRQVSSSSSSLTPPPEEFNRLRQIVEGSSVPIFVLDNRHIVTHWNKACEILTGLPAALVVGTSEHWRAFYTEKRPVMADLILDGANEQDLRMHYQGKFRKSEFIEGAFEAEAFFPKIGETGSWIYFTATPLYGPQHELVGTVETLQDFTERRRAEAVLKESEARYRQLSITDNLTGLFNSRHFYDQLKAEIGRAVRYEHPLSLMVMDVDNFKHFNDSYGHLEGDQVLRKLADVIRNCPRLGDSGYRVGGEEFAVLLPDTDIDSAHLVAERLRATFAAVPFSPLPHVAERCTVSIGVTRYQPYEKFENFVQRADSGCYKAKHQGKDRVVVV